MTDDGSNGMSGSANERILTAVGHVEVGLPCPRRDRADRPARS